jgi:hypothetical protein
MRNYCNLPRSVMSTSAELAGRRRPAPKLIRTKLKLDNFVGWSAPMNLFSKDTHSESLDCKTEVD